MKKSTMILSILIIFFITACDNKSSIESISNNYREGNKAYTLQQYEKAASFLKRNADISTLNIDPVSDYLIIDSQFFLGHLILDKMNDHNGLKYLEMAAGNNHPRAVESLTALYRDGMFGIEKNPNKAVFWFDKLNIAKEIWNEKEKKVISLIKKK